MASIGKIDKSLPHYEVRCFLAGIEAGPKYDAEVARLLSLPPGPYTTDVQFLMDALDAAKAWWSVSHIMASVVLTVPAPGAETVMSNPVRYDKRGGPLHYRSSRYGRSVAVTLCEAWIKCVYDLPDAYFVLSRASQA